MLARVDGSGIPVAPGMGPVDGGQRAVVLIRPVKALICCRDAVALLRSPIAQFRVFFSGVGRFENFVDGALLRIPDSPESPNIMSIWLRRLARPAGSHPAREPHP